MISFETVTYKWFNGSKMNRLISEWIFYRKMSSKSEASEDLEIKSILNNYLKNTKVQVRKQNSTIEKNVCIGN